MDDSEMCVRISKLCLVAGQCSLKDYIKFSPIMHTCRPTPHLLPRPWVVEEALSLLPDLSCPGGM